ncbi:MAG: hypothetical protein V4496_01210 [Pseudomonadota bacterium]
MRLCYQLIRQWFWALPLLVLPISAFFFAPGLEIEADNLKYMGIAWSMQETGNYLVPFANGVPYTDKPPLLFWMILACWHVFGINAVGLQCLVSLLLGAWIVMTKATYSVIFPEDNTGKTLLPYLMIGSFAILDYAHFLHVDLFLVTGVLLTNLGICKRLHASFARSNLYIVLGVFIGLFAKGPVIYVFTLLPFFMSMLLHQSYRAHFLKIIGLVMMGTALFLMAWVVPVIFMTSHEFLQQILYKQVANRATFVDDKTHFFYLLKLPYLLLPWSLAILFIRKFSNAVTEVWRRDVFVIAIIVMGVAVLSFFGQKRFWYLLPCIPYCMIILTRFFVVNTPRFLRWIKIASISAALLFATISPYYFSLIENSFQLKLMKQVFSEQKTKGNGVVMLSNGGPIYLFNYFAKMHFIATLNSATDMQQWLVLHPRGIVIVHAKQCPEPLHLVLYTHEMHYALCQSIASPA